MSLSRLVMDMSLLARALGLDFQATGSLHFGGDVGSGFPTIPIEWSGRNREDLTSTTLGPGHTQWVAGTSGSFLGTVRRKGVPINASNRGPGVPPGAPSLFPGGPTGVSLDDVGKYSHRCS